MFLCINLHYSSKVWDSFLLLLFITFIKQGHIKLIKSNSKDIYSVSKEFLNFLFVKESWKKVSRFPQKYIMQHNCIQHW